MQVTDAQYLARQGYIVSQANSDHYALDRDIFRQEIIGVALKITDTQLVDGYICQNYFDDVSNVVPNNWACRAVEMASDLGLVTRANTSFRPQDPISKAEAVAILMQSLGMEKASPISQYEFDEDVVAWQKPYIAALVKLDIIRDTKGFEPNKLATRGEIFSLAASLVRASKPSFTSFSETKKSQSKSFLVKKPEKYSRKTSKKVPTYVKYKK